MTENNFIRLLDDKKFKTSSSLKTHNRDSHFTYHYECGMCFNLFHYKGFFCKHKVSCNGPEMPPAPPPVAEAEAAPDQEPPQVAEVEAEAAPHQAPPPVAEAEATPQDQAKEEEI